MKLDPFAINALPRWHPTRLVRTARMHLQDRMAGWKFDSNALPEKMLPALPKPPPAAWADTAVTPVQMSYLLAGLGEVQTISDVVVVELGSYRGVTTRALALATPMRIIAIDPYTGYGGSESDYAIFRRNTGELPNVIHERTTSGQAFAEWKYGKAGFVFIDAVRDYANTSFDLETWSKVLAPGGIIALHDTDNPLFPGTRQAATEGSRRLSVFAHVKDLVLLRNHTSEA